MTSAVIALLISLAMGGAAWYFTRNRTDDIKVSTRELIIGTAVSMLVLFIAGPLVEGLIINSKETYYEYYNGIEVKANDQVTTCDRDGACSNAYACDPYIVMVDESYTDGKGHYHYREEPETRYHSCPYLRTEHTYTIDTTLGTYTIASGIAGPDRAPWGGGHDISFIQVGPPTFWLQAKNRIAAGRPGGVTELHTYKNFLLASDKTLLKAYSAHIANYQSKGLLPSHTASPSDPIHTFYLADKFQAVKVQADTGAWNEALMRLNGYFGKELQGDIHMAAVDASAISDPDDYSQALFAYWKGNSFGKYAFPKNGLAIVLGVKNGQVVWARAVGGLPTGNETLLADIQSQLPGQPFTPEAIIGTPKSSPGVLTQALWGPDKYQRPCMTCSQGYGYLKSDVYVTGWDRFWVVFVSALLSGVMWVVFLGVADQLDNRLNWY